MGVNKEAKVVQSAAVKSDEVDAMRGRLRMICFSMKHNFDALKSCSKCQTTNIAYVADKLYATAAGSILTLVCKLKT